MLILFSTNSLMFPNRVLHMQCGSEDSLSDIWQTCVSIISKKKNCRQDTNGSSQKEIEEPLSPFRGEASS